MAAKDPNPLRIGVLIHAPVQLLDLAPIDLFGMLTRDYLAACTLPAPIVNLGIPVAIKYISSEPFSSPPPSSPTTPPPEHLAATTAAAAVRLSTHIGDASVAPDSLDIILIPGPDPRLEVPGAVAAWLRAHWEHGRQRARGKAGGARSAVTLLSVCTGVFILAGSGVLDGLEATGPRALVGELRGRYPRVQWTDKVRWVRSSGKGEEEEGRIWTSGGITNGIDMVAAYIREQYPGPLSDTVCMMADVGDRGREYSTGKVVSNGMWLWAVLRAWWVGK